MREEQKLLPKDEGRASDMDTEVIEGTVESGEGPYMSEAARKVNALSVEAWKKWQIAGGVLLGFVCAACLFLLKSDGFLPLNFLAALLVAKFAPSYAEKQLRRKLDVGRIALVIALAAALIGYLVYYWMTGTM